MVAIIRAFIFCCFAITSSIKTVESADNSKVSPILYFPLYNELYVHTINHLKTFKEVPIIFQTKEKDILFKSCANDEDIQFKIESLVKFENKIQDVQCSFWVITQFNILTMKKIVDEVKRGEYIFFHNPNTVKRLQMEANTMLQVLIRSNFESEKWPWTIFLKTFAFSQYGDNKPFIGENPFEDDQLLTGVSDVIENCVADKNLPPTVSESDFISKNMRTYNSIFHHLQYFVMNEDVFKGRVLEMIEFVYLKPFWNDNQLLFKEIEEVKVDWSAVKQQFELEMAITKEFLDNRTWIYQPHGRLDHQDMLVKIVDARIYCYLAVVLHVYEQQLFMLDVEVLTRIKDRINNVVLEALKLTAYKDDFLGVISSELESGETSGVDHISDISARVRTKANGTLNDLNGASSNEIDLLSFNVDEDQLLPAI
ncbi:uncharacterized protein LOC126839500 isoform X2 [Adelges cooleyi]|uniref:uncharacterized protein LOC126839500 isoform X2 n=1 Tax=Adelges cooleyi TaxID=133065 RepID=UPI00217F5E9C|nr:uncharacterized protein LOC126839500 isoform X2 [Adelges cooleyi]